MLVIVGGKRYWFVASLPMITRTDRCSHCKQSLKAPLHRIQVGQWVKGDWTQRADCCSRCVYEWLKGVV